MSENESPTFYGKLASQATGRGPSVKSVGQYERILVDRLRVLGPDHPETLGARHNLAYTYETAGRVGEAVDLFEQVISETVRVLGPDHPNTLTIRRNLASARDARDG